MLHVFSYTQYYHKIDMTELY